MVSGPLLTAPPRSETTVHDVSSHVIEFVVDGMPAIYEPMKGDIPGSWPMFVLLIPVEEFEDDESLEDLVLLLKVRQGRIAARSKMRPRVMPAGFVEDLVKRLQGMDAMNMPRDEIFRGAKVRACVTLRKVDFDSGPTGRGRVHQLHLDRIELVEMKI